MGIEWIIGAIVAVLAAVAGSFGLGHSKGKSVAEAKATEEKSQASVVAANAAAEKQVQASKEASNVDQSVNNLSDSDVDKQLSDKWSR